MHCYFQLIVVQENVNIHFRYIDIYFGSVYAPNQYQAVYLLNKNIYLLEPIQAEKSVLENMITVCYL